MSPTRSWRSARSVSGRAPHSAAGQQGPFVRLRRLRRWRRSRHRVVAGHPTERPGLVPALGLEVVEREGPDLLVERDAGAFLDGLADAGVEVAPPAVRQALVRRVADQRVAAYEGLLPPAERPPRPSARPSRNAPASRSTRRSGPSRSTTSRPSAGTRPGHCRMAGDHAMSSYANVEATKAYERALLAGRRVRGASRSDLADLHERVGDIRYELGEPTAAVIAYQAARRLASGSPAIEARLALKQAKQRRVKATTRGPCDAERAIKSPMVSAAAKPPAGVRTCSCGTAGRVTPWATRPMPSPGVTRRQARRARADDALAQAYQANDAAYFDNGEVAKAKFRRRSPRRTYRRLRRRG